VLRLPAAADVWTLGSSKEKNRINTKSGFVSALFLIGFAVAGTAEQVVDNASSGFPVEFTDCVESIGVGLVPTEHAWTLVPSAFQLVGEGQAVTPLVVRTAHCSGIAVGGHRPKAGAVVQIGAIIVPPDFTGDINNYTLWDYTSDSHLARHLARLGVSA